MSDSKRYVCSKCGGVNILQNELEHRMCADCACKKTVICAYFFTGKSGKVYTARMIRAQTAKRGHQVCKQTAYNRIREAIADPSSEKNLLKPPQNKRKVSLMPVGENLTAEQEAVRDDFRAVHDGRMSLNELLDY